MCLSALGTARCLGSFCSQAYDYHISQLYTDKQEYYYYYHPFLYHFVQFVLIHKTNSDLAVVAVVVPYLNDVVRPTLMIHGFSYFRITLLSMLKKLLDL